LLDGVLAVKGQWRDASPLLAVPNYARNNRSARAASTGPFSLVWMKDKQAF
jgi:hypothetical protein